MNLLKNMQFHSGFCRWYAFCQLDSGSQVHGLKVQWNLDLSFFKGMEKQNDECGKTINPGNYYTL